MEECNYSPYSPKVTFECCTNCSSHSWCTRHDQSKYQAVFLSIQNAIHTHLPSLQIGYNQLPQNYISPRKETSANDNRYFDTVTKKSVYFPGLGAFEIHFNNILIFSKYESERWPQAMEIISLLQQVVEEYDTVGNLKKYEMFQIPHGTEPRTVEDEERRARMEIENKVKEISEDAILSLAEFEKYRSGSLSKKRQFGNKAYNKIFKQVQQELEEKEVRNVEELYMDPNIQFSERSNESRMMEREQDSARRVEPNPSNKFIFTSHGGTAYSGFTQKTNKLSKDKYKDDLTQLLEERQTFYKRKYKQNISLTDNYWMYRNSKKSKEPQLQNLQKIKSLKKDINKLNSTNNLKISQLSELNSQMPLIKSSNYNQLLMKMPQFIKKKGSQEFTEKEMILRLDNIEEENAQQNEEGNRQGGDDKRTPYHIMNEWDRELEMLETRFQKFEKKVEVMKLKKQEFEDGSSLEKKFEELIKGDQKSNKLEKEYLMLLRNQPPRRGSRKVEDYMGISPEERSEKLKRIYGRWKAKEYAKAKLEERQGRELEPGYSEEEEEGSRYSLTSGQYKRGYNNDFSQKRQFQNKYSNSTGKGSQSKKGRISQAKYQLNCHHIPQAYFDLKQAKETNSKTKRKNQSKIQEDYYSNLKDKSAENQRISFHQGNQSRTANNYYSKHKELPGETKTPGTEYTLKQKYIPGGFSTDSFHNRNSTSNYHPNKKNGPVYRSDSKLRNQNKQTLLSKQSEEKDLDMENMGPSRRESEEVSADGNSEEISGSEMTLANEIKNYKKMKMMKEKSKEQYARGVSKDKAGAKSGSNVEKRVTGKQNKSIPKKLNSKPSVREESKSPHQRESLSRDKPTSKDRDSNHSNTKDKNRQSNTSSHSNFYKPGPTFTELSSNRISNANIPNKPSDRNNKSQTSRDQQGEITNRSTSKAKNESRFSNGNINRVAHPGSRENSKESRTSLRNNNNGGGNNKGKEQRESRLKKEFSKSIKAQNGKVVYPKERENLKETHSDVQEEDYNEEESSIQQNQQHSRRSNNASPNTKRSLTSLSKPNTNPNQTHHSPKSPSKSKSKNQRSSHKNRKISKNQVNVSILPENENSSQHMSRTLQSNTQLNTQKSKLSLHNKSHITKKNGKSSSKLSVTSNSNVKIASKQGKSKEQIVDENEEGIQLKDNRRYFQEDKQPKQHKLGQQDKESEQNLEQEDSEEVEDNGQETVGSKQQVLQKGSSKQKTTRKQQGKSKKGENEGEEKGEAMIESNEQESEEQEQSIQEQKEPQTKTKKTVKKGVKESKKNRDKDAVNDEGEQQPEGEQSSEMDESEGEDGETETKRQKDDSKVSVSKSNKKKQGNKQTKQGDTQVEERDQSKAEEQEQESKQNGEQDREQNGEQGQDGVEGQEKSQLQKQKKVKKGANKKSKNQDTNQQIIQIEQNTDEQNVEQVTQNEQIKKETERKQGEQNKQSSKDKQQTEQKGQDIAESNQVETITPPTKDGEGLQSLSPQQQNTGQQPQSNPTTQQQVVSNNQENGIVPKEGESLEHQQVASPNQDSKTQDQKQKQKQKQNQNKDKDEEVEQENLGQLHKQQTNPNTIININPVDNTHQNKHQEQHPKEQQDNNIPSTLENQQNSNTLTPYTYTGPTNKDLEQKGQLMVGQEISQGQKPKSTNKLYKDAGVQNNGLANASSQTYQSHPLGDISNKMQSKAPVSDLEKEQIRSSYERKLDMKRANILNNIYFQNNQIFKVYPKCVVDHQNRQYIDREFPASVALKGVEKAGWESARSLFKEAELFPEEKKWNMSDFTIEDKKNKAFGTVIKMLVARKSHIITRLFENTGVSTNGLYGIWLCHNSAWTQMIIDDYIPIIPNSEIPLFLNSKKYLWPSILQKSIAKLVGGYLNFEQLSIPEIFKILTGSNFVTFKIKEDPSMNSKAIRYVSQNQNKNFILHCQKHKKEVPNSSVAKLPEILTIQSAQSIDQKDLIQLKIDEGEPFWMKFEIFCQTFKCIHLLHLRQTYLFTHIPVVLYPSSYTVVELRVQGATSAEVSLCHLGDEDQLPKTTRVILYRQQQKSILKLVGQAKQKNKKLIFFDCQLRKGRYFLFIQGQKNYSDAILSYSGQQKAYMKIIQNIENQTMKNKNNEYIPISRENRVREKEKEAPKYMNNIFEFGGARDRVSDRISDNSEKLERIKNQFLEYLANQK